MKKDLLTLVIGILIGAIIATGIYLVLEKNSSNKGQMPQGGQSQMGQPPSGNSIGDGNGPGMENQGGQMQEKSQGQTEQSENSKEQNNIQNETTNQTNET